MNTLNRRFFLGAAAAGAWLANTHAIGESPPTDEGGAPIAGVKPISPEEHAARVAKLQGLMQRGKVAALLVEAGSSLEYFTGIRWWRSERPTAALIPASGKAIVVTPFFEVPSVEESLRIEADVRPWHEDQSPFALIADAMKANTTPGPLAVEWTTRFFIIDHTRAVPG